MNIHQARLREAAIRRASIVTEARKAGARGITRAALIERLKMTESNATHAVARLVEEGKLFRANDGKKIATYFAKREDAERASIHRGDRSGAGSFLTGRTSRDPGRGQGAGVPAVRAA